MRRAELTVLLPPAEQLTNGDIICRTYPLVITGTVHTPMVYVEDIYISPGNGVLDVKMTGEGVYERRHTIGVTSSSLPQAAATEMQPLEIRLMNLNTDASVYVVLVLSSVEFRSSGAPVTFGGAVRFRGKYPLGTSGVREENYDNRDNNKSVIADGPLWKAVLTTNSIVEIRNIRDITSMVRVLSATGTGAINVTGGSRRMIIVKKDGVTLEVEAESLDFRNIFELDLPTSGNVRILGLVAEAVATAAIKNGAITEVKLANNSVATTKVKDGAITPLKLDRAYSEPGHNHVIANVSGLSTQLASKAPLSHTHDISDVSGLQSQINSKANVSHTHSLDLPLLASVNLGSGTYNTGTHILGQTAYNGSGGTALMLIAWARGYGGGGTTGNARFVTDFSTNGGSTWSEFSGSGQDYQLDQGVDSLIMNTVSTGFSANGVLRWRLVVTSGTVVITGGRSTIFSIKSSI